MPRQIKTPEQRATEALDVARRVEVRAMQKHRAAVAAEQEAAAELIATRERLEYAGLNPALPTQTRADIKQYLIRVRPAPEEPEDD